MFPTREMAEQIMVIHTIKYHVLKRMGRYLYEMTVNGGF